MGLGKAICFFLEIECSG